MKINTKFFWVEDCPTRRSKTEKKDETDVSQDVQKLWLQLSCFLSSHLPSSVAAVTVAAVAADISWNYLPWTNLFPRLFPVSLSLSHTLSHSLSAATFISSSKQTFSFTFFSFILKPNLLFAQAAAAAAAAAFVSREEIGCD